MKEKNLFLMTLLVALLHPVGCMSVDVPVDKLPEQVKQTVLSAYPQARLVSAEKEKENGVLYYEVTIAVAAGELEVKTTKEGRLVEVEQEISQEELPDGVKKVIQSTWADARINEVEKVVAGDRTFYELELEQHGIEREVQLAADGTILGSEEGEKEGEDDDR